MSVLNNMEGIDEQELNQAIKEQQRLILEVLEKNKVIDVVNIMALQNIIIAFAMEMEGIDTSQAAELFEYLRDYSLIILENAEV